MDQIVVAVSPVEMMSGSEPKWSYLEPRGQETIRAEDLAEWCGTIPWEILTGISHRVPRVYRGIQAS